MSWLNFTTGVNETVRSIGFNNTTTTDGPNGYEQYKEPTGLYILRLVLFSFIILTGLIGNSVICKAIWSMPFQKPFSYFLVANMAFAEILNNLCSTFMLADWEIDFSNVILGNITCVLNPLQVLSLMVVTYSMAAIALYRYKVLMNRFSQAPPRKAKTLIIQSCLWLMPAAICVPTFLGFKFEQSKCALQSVLFSKTHVITRFVLNFAVPYFVILVSYGAVAMSLRKRIVKRAAQDKTSINQSSTAVVEIEGPLELQNRQREGNFEERQRSALNVASNRSCSKPENTDLEKDLLKMIYAIILIFMICYFPYQAVFLWEKIVEADSWQFYYHLLLQKYGFVLTCLPSALHPLCYGTMNRFYANAFARIFLCKAT